MLNCAWNTIKENNNLLLKEVKLGRKYSFLTQNFCWHLLTGQIYGQSALFMCVNLCFFNPFFDANPLSHSVQNNDFSP